jgi:hypothetical protein
VHPLGIPEGTPGEASELIYPALLEELAIGDPVRDVDREVGKVEGLGGLLRSGLAAPANQQLAEAPTHEAQVVMEAGEAFLRSQREKVFQEPRRLGAGSGEGGVDRSEDRGERIGLVKCEKPASHLPAARANGEQVKELLVLLHRPICCEQVLQSGGIEMPVLHVSLLSELL